MVYTGYNYGQGLAGLGEGVDYFLKGVKERAVTKVVLDAVDSWALGDLGNVPLPSRQAAPMASTGGDPRASLIQNESGGRWNAQNDAVGAGGAKGHFGRLQFGQARLKEAEAAGAIPAGTTPQAFMASPELQVAAERWHFGDIDNFIKSRGLDRAVGGRIGDTPVTLDGMRAVAHLGGKGGLEKFIATGGKYNPADENGTRLSDYLARHGGASQASPEQMGGSVPVQVAQAGGGSMPQAQRPSQLPAQIALIRALMANPETRQMGQQLLMQVMSKSDFGFQVIGDQLYRTNSRTGQIEPVPGVGRPTSLQVVKGADGNDYSFNPVTGDRKLLVEGDKQRIQEVTLSDGSKVSVRVSQDGTVRNLDGSEFKLNSGGPRYQPMTLEQRRLYNVPEGTPAFMGPDGKPQFGPASRSEQGEFGKAADKKMAEYFSTHAEGGGQAANVLQEVGVLRGVLAEAPQGPLTGRLAQMFPGFSTSGDVFNSRVSAIAPQLRVPGSGATSDRDLDTFLKALPALRNDPNANKIILDVVERKAAINLERAEISRRALRREITPEDADRQIRDLDKKSVFSDDAQRIIIGRASSGATTPSATQAGQTNGGAALPRVASPADASRLPSGTRFYDPNGVLRQVP